MQISMKLWNSENFDEKLKFISLRNTEIFLINQHCSEKDERKNYFIPKKVLPNK